MSSAPSSLRLELIFFLNSNAHVKALKANVNPGEPSISWHPFSVKEARMRRNLGP